MTAEGFTGFYFTRGLSQSSVPKLTQVTMDGTSALMIFSPFSHRASPAFTAIAQEELRKSVQNNMAKRP